MIAHIPNAIVQTNIDQAGDMVIMKSRELVV